jgi:hypothetical protein
MAWRSIPSCSPANGMPNYPATRDEPAVSPCPRRTGASCLN